MWVVIYKADRVGITYHQTFKTRKEARGWMLEYIEYGGTGALLCRATEGFGSLLYDDDDLPLEMQSDQKVNEVLNDMESKSICQQSEKNNRITHSSESTLKNTESTLQ